MRTLPAAFFLVLVLHLAAAPAAASDGILPATGSWLHQGLALDEGEPGSWDAEFAGISPCAILRRDGQILVYYIGADGTRSFDDGPRHRALGAATSSDGIHFEKYAGNPVLTFLPNGGEEEGVFSCAAAEDEAGQIAMFYGGLRESGGSHGVDIEIRMQVSSDGYLFGEDRLIRAEAGAELSPVAVLRLPDAWHLYYVVSDPEPWRLRRLSGPDPDALSGPQPLTLLEDVRGLSLVPLDGGRIAAWLNRLPFGVQREVRMLDSASPGVFGDPISSVSIPSLVTEAVYLDLPTGRWLRYAAVFGDPGKDPEVSGIAAYTAPVEVQYMLEDFEGPPGTLPAGAQKLGRVSLESEDSFAGAVETSEGHGFLCMHTGPGSTGEGVSGIDLTGDGGLERDGAVASLVVVVPLPGALAFDYDFVTSEITGGLRDPLAIGIDGVLRVPIAVGGPNGSFFGVSGFDGNPLAGPDGAAFVDGQWGFRSLYFPVTAGRHVLQFYVADEGDGTGDTGVLIDNLRLIPEPSAPLQLATGLAALAGLVRLRARGRLAPLRDRRSPSRP